MTTDAEKAAAALSSAAMKMRQFALDGTKVVAQTAQVMGTANLTRRHGGGKYKRGAAHVIAREDNKGWFVALNTPWLGMEFGGHVTNVWDNRIGTSRQAEIGLKPMWAPWHADADKGYIIGSAVAALMESGSPTAAVADAVLAGFTAEFDKFGVPK